MKTLWNLLTTTFNDFMADKALTLAAAIAFYTIFSLGPVLVIVIAVAGFVWGEQAVEGELVSQISGTVGEGAAQQIEIVIRNASRGAQGIVATIISVVLLIIAATGVFSQVKDSLNTVWDVKPKGGLGVWGVIRDRLFAFLVVLGIAILLLLVLIASTVTAAISDALPIPPLVMSLIDIAASFAIVTVAFAAIFKWLPDVKIAWRDVWAGAAVTAILFALGKYALGIYLGYTSTASVYGAAGSLILVLLWVYYSALIFLFGAEFTQVYARRWGKDIHPGKYAERVGDLEREQRGLSVGKSHQRESRPEKDRDAERREPATIPAAQQPNERGYRHEPAGRMQESREEQRRRNSIESIRPPAGNIGETGDETGGATMVKQPLRQHMPAASLPPPTSPPLSRRGDAGPEIKRGLMVALATLAGSALLIAAARNGEQRDRQRRLSAERRLRREQQASHISKQLRTRQRRC